MTVKEGQDPLSALRGASRSTSGKTPKEWLSKARADKLPVKSPWVHGTWECTTRRNSLLSTNTRHVLKSHWWHSAALMPKPTRRSFRVQTMAFEVVKAGCNELQGECRAV